jgi:hypothetical protein
MASDQAAERGQSGSRSLAHEQRTAKLFLEQLDRAAKRWLAYSASSRRRGEILLLAERKEVTDLLHFHQDQPALMNRQRSSGSCASSVT